MMRFVLALGCIWVMLLRSAVAADPAPSPMEPQPAVIVTIQGERISAPLRAIEEGKLIIPGEPVRTFPLDELQRIEFGAPGALSAIWIGQDSRDLVQVGGAEGGNGVQDMHLRLIGLRTDRQIKQIFIGCHYPGQPRGWRLDTTRSPHWRLAIERSDGGRGRTAEVYLEPNSVDAFDQLFAITVTYDDDTTAKASVKATTHTSDQLKQSAASAAATSSEPAPATVYLEGRGLLRGQVLELTDASLRLRTPWSDEVTVPLLQVLAIRFGNVTSGEAQARFEKQLASPGSEDRILVVGPEQAIVEIEGAVAGISDGKLRLTYDGESRAINQPRLVGIVFAAHPPVRSTVAAYQVFNLSSGDRIAGLWKGVTADQIEIETVWQEPAKLPRDSITEITFHNGKMVYLSDLDPVKVEETPYFSRRMPYQRDRGLLGGPLRMKGTDYSRGLAVHSRCVLTYAIDGQFATFKAVVGFDESAGTQGNAICRVLADGTEIFARPTLRSSEDPQVIDVSVAGVKQLTLEVDFGESEDICDRVIWADARLFRDSAAQP